MFGIVFKKLMFNFGEEISGIRLCCGRYSPTEIKNIYEEV
jgi:hypothetical protein